MATFDDLRRLALQMPGAEEITYRDNPWFNVGSKTFALGQQDRTILKLEKSHQEFLFEVRPETFRKFTFGPNVWAYVELDHLDEAELAELLREAWAMIVPKKVSRPYLASLTAPTSSGVL